MVVTILFLPLSQTEITKMQVQKLNVHKTDFPPTRVNKNGGCLRTGN